MCNFFFASAMYSIYSKLPPLSTSAPSGSGQAAGIKIQCAGLWTRARGVIRGIPGPAATNVKFEPKFMLSDTNGSAPRQPGRVVLTGTGPQGLAPGAAA
jgi:hypothetical protein